MQNLDRTSFLLNLLQTEHTQLENLLNSLSPEQMLQAGVTGSWSIKDVLAHLTWWEQAMISELLYGVELDPGLGEEPWSTERANALTVEAQRQTPLSEVLDNFHRSYQQTLHMIENLSASVLADDEIYTHLLNNTGNHYAEHRRWIEAGLRSQEPPASPAQAPC